MAGGADIRAGRAFVELFLKNSLTKGLGQAQKQLNAFGKQATSVGKTLIGVGVGAAVPFAFLTKTFMDFDDAMRAVQGVTQASAADFAKLTEKAKALGASTSFTAVQVANLMVELGRAGFSPDQVNEMTGAVLDLSRATGTDATLSAGIMAASIRQFSLAAGDATRVADALTTAANKSFNTVESLGEALSYAGPVAADFNMSIEDTLAVLGALGNVGIQGSNAGTAVRRLLTLGAAEAEKMKEIFGVAFTDAAGNARPLVDALDEVNKATANLGTAERAKKFNEAFGLLGITGASAISKNVVSVKALRDELAKAQGAAAKTAKTMDAGLGGAFRIMMSAIEGVQIAIGNALAPVLTMVANRVEKFSTALIKLIDENKMLAVGALSLVVGITAAGVALVALGFAANAAASGLGVLVGIITAIATAGGFLLSPLGLVTAALIGGAVAWAKYTDSGKAAMLALKSIFGNIAKTASDAFGGIKAALGNGDLALAGKIAFAALKTIALETFDSIKANFKPLIDTFVGLWDVASTFFTAAVEGLKTAWGTFTSFFTGDTVSMGKDWADFAEGIVAMFTQAARVVVDVWQAAVTEIAKLFLNSKLLTGVDMKKEQREAVKGQLQAIKFFEKRRDEKKAELANETDPGKRKELELQIADAENSIKRVTADNPHLMTDAENAIDANIGGQADAFRKKLDGLDKRARDRGAAPAEEDLFRGATPAEKARFEMNRLIAEANKAKADAATKAAEEKAAGAGEIDAARAGGVAAMKGGAGFGSFSAAGLLAGGGRGNIPQQQLAVAKVQAKLQKETLDEDKELNKRLAKGDLFQVAGR